MFREDKTTQMTARFLQLANGRIPYIKILKMLYLADKQMLVERGKPISYDRWYAMKHGPVLSSTYNLIKGAIPSAYWSKHIKTEGYDVVLTSDPGSEALSPAEDRIIDSVFRQCDDHDQWELVRKLHDQLPEWTDPGDTSREMTYKMVLQTEGLSEEDIEGILENIKMQDDVQQTLEAL